MTLADDYYVITARDIMKLKGERNVIFVNFIYTIQLLTNYKLLHYSKSNDCSVWIYLKKIHWADSLLTNKQTVVQLVNKSSVFLEPDDIFRTLAVPVEFSPHPRIILI
jgi:hypothetical protein